MTFLSWSKVTSILSIGTAKGNLLIYNHQTSKYENIFNIFQVALILGCFRKIPILGKHSRRIISGCWSKDNLLALGSEDKMLTISNDVGDTLRQAALREVPHQIKFSERKQDNRSKLFEGTVCTDKKKERLRNKNIVF